MMDIDTLGLINTLGQGGWCLYVVLYGFGDECGGR